MCDLCKTYGRHGLVGKGLLKKAMDAITAEHMRPANVQHTSDLIDLWMKFEAGDETEANPEAAEAWERGHRNGSD